MRGGNPLSIDPFSPQLCIIPPLFHIASLPVKIISYALYTGAFRLDLL